MRIEWRLIAVVLLLGITIGAEAARAQGQSPSEAAPAGILVDGIIECGSGYSSHELYDAKITLVEFLRGDQAWERIQEADKSNQPPKPGFQYILARIKFTYLARGAPGDCTQELRGRQFVALASNGKKYDSPELKLPKPELGGTLRAGETLEGWVAFSVPTEDEKPLMTFRVDETGAVQHGGDMWFRLY